MIKLDKTIRQLAGNAEAIRALVQAFSEEAALWKPNSETWSLKDVMEHVYNEERFDFRKAIKEMLGGPSQHFDYISVQNHRQALEGFLAERESSIAWLRELKSPNWDISVPFPWGEKNTSRKISAGEVLVSWVDHDYLHMRQMIELLHAWNEKEASPYSVEYAGGW